MFLWQRGCDVGQVKWKEKFSSLKEVVIALKKFESPDDSNRVSFEGNLVVNHRFEFRSQVSRGKTHPLVTNSHFRVPRLYWNLSGRVEGVSSFEFEVFDVKR